MVKLRFKISKITTLRTYNITRYNTRYIQRLCKPKSTEVRLGLSEGFLEISKPFLNKSSKDEEQLDRMERMDRKYSLLI